MNLLKYLQQPIHFNDDDSALHPLFNWIAKSVVKKTSSTQIHAIYLASYKEDVLILTHDLSQGYPIIHIVFLSNGQSVVIHQNCGSHCTGLIWGERIEGIFSALLGQMKISSPDEISKGNS